MLLARLGRRGDLRVARLAHPRWASAAAAVDVSRLRNVGVIAHIDAGKTTTTERMLRLAGKVRREGRVDNGDTTTDFLPQERERGITIQSAAVDMAWREHSICLIDTPGHVDFTVEVERALRVLDGAVLVLDAVAGVQAQTETVWRQAQRNTMPAVAFVNKMDREGADFDKACQSLRERLEVLPVPLQLPVLRDSELVGTVDLLTMMVTLWGEDGASDAVVRPLDETDAFEAEVMAQSVAARTHSLELLADADDAFCEELLEEAEAGGDGDGASIPAASVVRAVRRAVGAGALVPVLCGAALRGRGVEPLLDSIVAFLPHPNERPPPEVVNSSGVTRVLSPESDGPLCAFAFKVSHDSHRGPLVYLRIYGGKLNKRQVLRNSTRESKERATHLLQPFADDLSHVDEVACGGTVVAVGLKDTMTGDTLVADRGPLTGFIIKRGITIPPPVFALSVEAEESYQQTAFEDALAILARDDPSLVVDTDQDSGQILLRGMGELHLEVACSRLETEFGLSVSTGAMLIAYREAVTRATKASVAYDRTFGERRLRVGIGGTLTPAKLDVDNEFTTEQQQVEVTVSKGVRQSLNAEERAALECGLRDAAGRGPVNGHPLIAIHIHVDKFTREQETTPGALRAAASALVAKLANEGDPVLVEPIMKLEILTPDEYLGGVLSDLTSTRLGQVREVVPLSTLGGGAGVGATAHVMQRTVVHALAPLASLLGYSTALRSISSGEAIFSMENTHYAPKIG